MRIGERGAGPCELEPARGVLAREGGEELPAATKQKIGNATRLKKKMSEGAEFPALPNGVYIFRVSITDSQGKTLSKVGKLVVAR